jgi:hypothetical protein
MYIQFEKYNIGYVHTQYIRFEKYSASMGMNGNRWMSMDGHWRMEGAERTELNKCTLMDVGWKFMDVRWNYEERQRTAMLTRLRQMTNGDGRWWWTKMDNDCDDAVEQPESTNFVTMTCKKQEINSHVSLINPTFFLTLMLTTLVRLLGLNYEAWISHWISP